MTEEQAIRRAVEKRIESLDDSFIGAVRAFEVAARAQSMHDIAGACSLRDAKEVSVATYKPAQGCETSFIRLQGHSV